jgi:YidC/Oxa1 family membrane protein insertase
MPILIAIFFAIRDYNYLQVPPSFLWLADLSLADTTFILPVLAAVTTFVQQKQTMASNPTASNPVLMYGMPIIIGWISLTFPSGLVLYWTTSNMVQIIQQWYMYRNGAAA